MSVQRMDVYDRDGRLKTAYWDSWFLYTAFAPMGHDEVLVKVGISTVPFERLSTIYCNCPFSIEYGAFTSIGRKKDALKCESRLIESFEQYKTRGEWLRMPMTAEAKREFAEKSKAIVSLVTGGQVEWRRVGQKEIVGALNLRKQGLIG